MYLYLSHNIAPHIGTSPIGTTMYIVVLYILCNIRIWLEIQ